MRRAPRLAVAAAAAAGAIAVPAAAQDHDPQIWTYVTAVKPIVGRTSLQLETAQRYSGDQQALFESQYLVAIQREIARDVSIIIGYNRVVSSSNGVVTATEDRPRIMLAFPIASIGTARLTSRVRVEPRFRSDDPEDGYRARAEYRLNIPIDDRGRAIRLMHEDYLNLNTTRFQSAGYERMRNAVTLLLPAGPARLEMGYLNQWRFNPAPRRDQMAHVFLVGVSLGL